ncbi:alpha-hydroxy-acid oxidizing protein [Aquipuribacter sp. SD81]|uniref:alpha-hydroxy-acid oxidizing protein n=1 Tax=Aquipuribacter sp. SD81 TaxID=3127703 RepID=UPI003017D3A4
MTSATGPGSAPPRDTLGRAVQSHVYRAGALGRRPRVPVAPDRLQRAARRAMSRRAWAYVAGSAGTEATAAANRAALDRHRLVPRVLRDVAVRDLGTEVLGRRRATPLLLAPMGAMGLVRRDADLAVARAAGAARVPLVVSTQASTPMEDTARALGGGEWWFQLYWSRDDDLVTSLVRRAEAAGASALVVTLDTHVLGWRPRDLDLGHLPFARGEGIAQYTSDPVFLELVHRRARTAPSGPRPRPTPAALATLASLTARFPGGSFAERLRSPLPRAAVETFLDVFSRSDLTWQHLARLRERTRLPILLKGVQHADDASRALDAGVDGVVVSNHGGRQVDGAVGALDALPAVVARVGGRVPVLFDSGVRTGADVAKALALGADLVGLGRPWAYGLAVGGAAGVGEVVRNVLAELDLTLALLGARDVADLRQPGVLGGSTASSVPGADDVVGTADGGAPA